MYNYYITAMLLHVVRTQVEIQCTAVWVHVSFTYYMVHSIVLLNGKQPQQ